MDLISGIIVNKCKKISSLVLLIFCILPQATKFDMGTHFQHELGSTFWHMALFYISYFYIFAFK